MYEAYMFYLFSFGSTQKRVFMKRPECILISALLPKEYKTFIVLEPKEYRV